MVADNKMAISELKSLVQKFCEDRNWTQFHNPKELSIGLVTESAELLDLFRFKSDEQMKQIIAGDKRELVADELADILFFLLRFSQLNNIDLDVALKNKLAKNELKYPVDIVKGKNKKYNEY